MSQPSSNPEEKTFRAYNQSQGRAYAKVRRDYHPNVYQAIIDHHTSTGGKLDTLLDVGCGPGNAAHSLAPHFAHVVGLDPSEGMIATARAINDATPDSEHVRFEISAAEQLGSNLTPPIEDGSVDLITAANAAHWFDMAGFWPAAARVLKPGGSVALWTSGEIRAHPSLPNAVAIQAAFDKHEERLTPYYEPGNLIVRGRYHDLLLPWTLEQPTVGFEESNFTRKEWDVGEKFYKGELEVDLDMMEKMLATGSAQTRWRQDHPDDVGTERDLLKILRKEVERLLREAGVNPGEERLKGSVQGVLLVVKKSP